jgi:IclR family acetate operon transcriptional repressor
VPHATAVGKVFLAYGGELPAGRLPAYTARTITDRAALESEISRISEHGFAQAIGEREEDLNAIAAPIHAGRGELVAILGVQGPAARFGPEEMRQAVPELIERAAAISSALGHRA